ncbi:GDYXXLXY domain-containing protein [Aquimarina spongiae]|uniref:Uncharacterized membrane-anchored protein n=1 Tax=Aquimarina spongiae TaxID=570521 RepID=A0A1M6IQU6_9FLAO|nr:GDYXXLXY domain-containing protein [Aquimarina spongiae]SHJ36765.1 Uncharacterized membrane-anchored protein [Aquimarina spongiae]
MKTIHLFIGFIVLALIQIFIPVQMIYEQEDILKSGELYRFRTMPIDPSDPFRGKYITLHYEMNSFKMKDTTIVYGDEIKVYIDKDADGFAKTVQISKTELDIDKDFVLAKVTGNYNGVVNFELPFNRYYMEESKAYDAEEAYRKVNRTNVHHDVYGKVHIKEGQSVLSDVVIDGVSIKEYVEKEQ